MKKLLIVITLIVFASCKKEAIVDYAIISGTIENTTTQKITIYSQFDSSKRKEISLAEDGTFNDTFKMATHSYFIRQEKNMTEFYAPKGSTTYIEYDAKKIDSTLQIAGEFSSINNYMIAKAKVSLEEIGDRNELYLKSEEDFKTHLLKVKSAHEDLLFNSANISEEFNKKETKNINYEYLLGLGNYELYHGHYIENREFKVSEKFLDALKDLTFENEEDFLFSISYRGLTENNFRKMASKMMEIDSLLPSDITYLKSIINIKSDVIRNKLLYDDVQFGITYTEDLESYYSLFSNASSDIENNKIIKEAYNNLKKLTPGSNSPKFTDYENNVGGKMSLEDLKGTYVYFDIWATWCGPCIAEIPSLKKMEKQFHGKNIRFVSISIDTEDAYDKWKKMIVDKELGGIQLLADKNWKSQFVTDYMIKGIPRFILIDPQGKIVNANAPRPSDKKLVATLNGLNL
jgi:thiol-disulfide isomerase/thioredoxin